MRSDIATNIKTGSVVISEIFKMNIGIAGLGQEITIIIAIHMHIACFAKSLLSSGLRRERRLLGAGLRFFPWTVTAVHFGP